MNKHESLMGKAVSLLLLASPVLAGCAGGVRPEGADIVRPGDRVDIHYLCRLKTGEIVAATDSLPEGQPTSTLFQKRGEGGPLSVTAVGPESPSPERQERSLEEEIRDRLGRSVVGMKEDERSQQEFTAEDAPDRIGQNYVARLSRVRRRPKESTVPRREYEYRTGKAPEIGQPFTLDSAFPGKVIEITDTDVRVRFEKPGDVIETPLGPGFIREDDKTYTIEISARKGALVRMGVMTGRITDVDDQVVTVDFRNPFGGETIVCEVTVAKIEEVKPTRSEAGE